MAGKGGRKTTVGLVALGCAKNTVDLQVMAGHLLKAGFALAPDPDGADILLVNTCAFIEAAREEAAAELLRACELKRAGRVRAVIGAGCFVQRYGAGLKDAFPDVDAFLGIDSLDKIAAVARRALARPVRRPAVGLGSAPCALFNPPEPALRLTGKAFAYLKIAEGCSHACSYCAIPAIRGKYRSRRPEDVLAEARSLIGTGARELNVIAQDPMLYGCDLRRRGADGGRYGLVDLLKDMDGLEGDFWVRVLYSYPSEITDGFLEWMRTSPHACRYVDVPLQHTDPAILAAMKRKSAVEATLSAAKRIRAAVPGVTLRTTVMTGFPGEDEAAFARLLSDVKRMRFDHLGVFAFSPEEGTAAAELPGRPPERTARMRAKAVMDAQREIWRRKAKAMEGKTFRALVTAPGIARLESQAPDVDGVVRFAAKDSPPAGEFVRVRIVRAAGYDLTGRIEQGRARDSNPPGRMCNRRDVRRPRPSPSLPAEAK